MTLHNTTNTLLSNLQPVRELPTRHNTTCTTCTNTSDKATRTLSTSSRHVSASIPFMERFPLELRTMIWAATMDEARVIVIVPCKSRRGGYTTTTKIPIALHICQESREAVLKVYQLRFGIPDRRTAKIYADLSRDVILFSEKYNTPDHFYTFIQYYPDVKEIKHIAITNLLKNLATQFCTQPDNSLGKYLKSAEAIYELSQYHTEKYEGAVYTPGVTPLVFNHLIEAPSQWRLEWETRFEFLKGKKLRMGLLGFEFRTEDGVLRVEDTSHEFIVNHLRWGRDDHPGNHNYEVQLGGGRRTPSKRDIERQKRHKRLARRKRGAEICSDDESE